MRCSAEQHMHAAIQWRHSRSDLWLIWWPGTFPAVLLLLMLRPSVCMRLRAFPSGRRDIRVPFGFFPPPASKRAFSVLLA